MMGTSGLAKVGDSVNATYRAVLNQRLQTATLSYPDDSCLLYEGDLGCRMRGVTFTTAINAGFERLSCTVLGRGMLDPSEAEAETMLERWRFGILRFMLRSEVVWVGRVVFMEYDYPDNKDGLDLCPFRLEAAGLYSVLTDDPADLGPDYTDEGASSSATQLVIDTITGHGWPIRPVFNRVEGTGVNLGQLRVTDQDTSLDVIVNALTAGGTEGVSYVLLVEEPEDGPILKQYGASGSGVADFQIPVRGVGIKRGWNGEEQAWRVKATVTDGEGSSSRADPASDSHYIDLHNGVQRERVIALSGMDNIAAEAGAATFLAEHGNPVAMTGNPQLVPTMGEPFAMVRNAEGALVPAWRLRSGRLARLMGYRRFDPDADDYARMRAIESTTFDVEAGSLDFSLDQRSVTSALHEDQGEVLRLRHALEPGFAHTGKLHFETNTVTQLPFTVDTLLTDGSAAFSTPGPTTVHFDITLTFDDNITSTGDMVVYAGCVIDDEQWDSSQTTMAKRVLFRNGLNAQVHSKRFTISRPVAAGPHTFQTYALITSGDCSIVHQEIEVRY